MSGATAVYVHIPFCETKCPYCDFNSFAVDGRDVDGYLEALLLEYERRGLPRSFSTVFVGGGTPTVLRPEQIARYLEPIRARLGEHSDVEFTVEANPGSLTAEKLAALRECGVNRVSIGAQSIFDRFLRQLGRVHRAADIDRAVGLCREAGIQRISLDFIFGIPGQTLRDWRETLERALAWEVEHLSCYALTFEPGTEFHARRSAGAILATSEGLELAMFRLTERVLRGAGMLRYEISNYARAGRVCQHNLNYWRNGSYVGFGAGAHSFVAGVRQGNERHLGRYAAAIRERGDAAVFRESLSGLDAARETLVFGLRTTEGVDLRRAGERFGVDLEGEVRSDVDRLVAGRFVVLEGTRLRLARRGWRVADEIAATFLA